MSWSGIEAIPLLEGETRKVAVERAYEGGILIVATEGDVTMEPIGSPKPEEPTTLVTRAQRQWMLQAAQILEDIRPGWTITDEHHNEGRKWPTFQKLEHPTASMWVEVDREVATFRANSDDVDDEEWAFWWRTIKQFAKLPAAIFHPDEYEMIATSLSAKAARARYGWV